jgi:hypothetical protein
LNPDDPKAIGFQAHSPATPVTAREAFFMGEPK